MEHLTPELICKELPGLRLDSWVNENVMMVPPLFVYTEIGEPAPDYGSNGHEERIAVHDRAMAEKVPQYSTDIAAAWKIIETVNARGWPFTVILGANGQVTAEAGSVNPNTGCFFKDDDYYTTVPEAICKTALLAMLDNSNKPH